jgi:predicted metal-dependent phosphoesterase TrpH
MAMLIDLHTHTRRGSSCSRLHTKDLVLQAKEMHLDAVCVTDHNTSRVVERVKAKGKEFGLLVLGGIEVRCMEGDILVFGLEESPQKRVLAQDLVKLVHSQGGVAVPAHPFRASAPSIGKKIFGIQGFDAVEVLNGNSSPGENRTALVAAEKLGLPGTGGSDSHSRKSVGRCVTQFDDQIENEDDLIAAIKSGRYRPMRLFDD